MATAEQYAEWIVKNQAKKGTPEFDTVAKAYQEVRSMEAAPKPAEPGIMAKIGDVVTGNLRATEETKTLPEWTTMPELNQLSMASAKTGLGTLLSSPQETVKTVVSNFPKVGVRQDAKGNYIMKSSIDGKDYVIPPGLSMGDLPRVLGGLAAFTPAGRATTIVGGGAAAGATQAAIEASQALTGGEFDKGDVALATGFGAAIPAAGKVLTPLANKAGEKIARALAPTSPQPTPGTMGSVGSAGVDIATLRQGKASELPVPIKLTEGQKTRAFDAQRFERETAKDPELGAPIRERFAQQNRQLTQNMDAFIDATGAETADLRSIGTTVDKALRDRAARDKAKIRSLYKEAEKAGETEAPVSMANVLKVLDDSASAESTAPVLVAARKELERLSGGDAFGGTNITLGNAEQLRKFINKVAGDDSTNIKFAKDLKDAIDAATEGAGGEKYRAARAARARYARDYENIGLVKNLIGQKRGSTDRAIALEDVLRKAIIEPSTSLDDVRQVRRLLQTEGENGKQAWRELQGGTIRHIRDEATKNVARNEAGDVIVSAAQLDRVIKQLDKSGKLDYVFGKKGAEQLRTINDVAQDVLTAPPGAVNTSNTASVILAAMDMAISGSVGLPAPVLSGLRLAARGVKDAKTRSKVKKVLGE